MLNDDDPTPPRGTVLVGSLDVPTAHPRAAEAVQAAARQSSQDAIGQAGVLALMAKEVLPHLTAEDVAALERRFRDPLIGWAAAGRRRLIPRLEDLERKTDELQSKLRTAAQYERLRQRYIALRRSLLPLAEKYDEVREALAQDR